MTRKKAGQIVRDVAYKDKYIIVRSEKCPAATRDLCDTSHQRGCGGNILDLLKIEDSGKSFWPEVRPLEETVRGCAIWFKIVKPVGRPKKPKN